MPEENQVESEAGVEQSVQYVLNSGSHTRESKAMTNVYVTSSEVGKY